MWSVLLYFVKILHTWNDFFFAEILSITVLSDYLNEFFHSSKVTVKAAFLDDLLLYSEILFLSRAEIVDKLSFLDLKTEVF